MLWRFLWNVRKKNQREYYSGKKKRHTLKTQIIATEKDLKIICLEFATGRCHDFKLFKNTTKIHPDINVKADSGYQGILKLHVNSNTPYKGSKKKPLTELQKLYNHLLSKRRIFIEHVNGHLKRFKIISTRYRNKRKKFKLRMNLIAGIYNYELNTN